MKTLKQLSILIILVFTISCSKDDNSEPIATPANFSEIKLSDIIAKESKMSSASIIGTTEAGIQLTPGTVIIYKTSENHYGKLEVVSIDLSASSNYAITFKASNFNAEGSVNNSTSNFLVNGTYEADLDLLTTGGEASFKDFFWKRLTTTNTNLEPENGAKFYKYIF